MSEWLWDSKRAMILFISYLDTQWSRPRIFISLSDLRVSVKASKIKKVTTYAARVAGRYQLDENWRGSGF